MNTSLLLAFGAAIAYYFRDSIAASFNGTTPPAPAITAATTAASTATAAGASPSAAATAGAVAAAATPPVLISPTFQADSADVHNGLTAMSTVDNPATLARALSAYGSQYGTYLLTVSQWNWYHLQSGLTDGIITSGTEVGDNAINAAQYLQLRQARGLV